MANNFFDENALLDKAIIFAVKHHAGTVRKISSVPYIIHPLETMQILYSMNAELPLLIAGVLHDTAEDTDATIEEITEHFGQEVGALVSAHTENKSLSWEERKENTIAELQTASRELKLLVMADKLSNLRSIASDFQKVGDKLWESFNAPKTKQSWYYRSIVDSLKDFHNYPETAGFYEELLGLCDKIFT